ncbi:MAG TPA: ATP-binding protein, partial [Actinomycetota bacterium]|nr:ATP-binding protein [Actinomycetota bacterium]
FPAGMAPEAILVDLAESAISHAELEGIGSVHLARGQDIDGAGECLFVARVGDDGFSAEERNLVRAMTRALGLTLAMIERQELLERLSKIQRSISHRAPLREVLDAVTVGAAEMLRVEVAGLRLIDPDDPGFALTASSAGVDDAIRPRIERTPVHEGAGGQAIVENRLVIVDDYQREPGMVPGFLQRNLQTAMAAPVHEHGEVAGSLVVASYRKNRRFTGTEQKALLALAEHASLALTDAKTVEAMREAQRSKDMFLAMVSHELKTPLTVIMGALRTLQVHGDDLPEELREEMMSSGWERGRELERLINRLLQGARAELASGEEDVFVEALIAKALRGFEHSRRVVVHAPQGRSVKVDRPAVEEIIGILLENAVSHSPEASAITIEATVADEELVVTVVNEGSLPDDIDVTTLFQPFQRSATASSPGVGLGLYIAGRVADTLGGGIEVHQGDGLVRFTVSVPVVPIDHHSGGPTEPVPPAGASARA